MEQLLEDFRAGPCRPMWNSCCMYRQCPPIQVLFTADLWVPLVNLRGVYILPGIPRLFTAMVDAHKAPFRGPACSTVVLYTNTVEGDLAGERHSMCSLVDSLTVQTSVP